MTTDRDLATAVAYIAKGGVVAAATETLFGLLADATRSDAIDRVVELKQRDATKAIALLLPNREAWAQVAEISDLGARLADRFWPGPLTIAAEARAGLDPRIVNEGTVAVRWPAPSVASSIATAWGGVLTATSANASGEPPCTTDAELRDRFAHAVRAGWLWIMPGRCVPQPPSTIVRVTEGEVRLVRPGAITATAIASALGDPGHAQ